MDNEPQKCPSDWTCSGCKYWTDGKCSILGGSSYWYGFCDGYVKKEDK